MMLIIIMVTIIKSLWYLLLFFFLIHNEIAELCLGVLNNVGILVVFVHHVVDVFANYLVFKVCGLISFLLLREIIGFLSTVCLTIVGRINELSITYIFAVMTTYMLRMLIRLKLIQFLSISTIILLLLKQIIYLPLLLYL